MIKYVIFDMDGTILNTIDDLADSVNYMLEQRGYPVLTVEEVKSMVGNGVKLLVERALRKQVSDEEFNRCFDIFSAHYEKNKNNKTAPYDGILDCMKTLTERGIKLAVVSNKYHQAVVDLTEEVFGEYIKVAIGESDEIKPKPEPHGVFKAMRELGADNTNTVYIGDSEVDYKTAVNSGLPFIGVSWGFRRRELLESLGAREIADKPSDIADILSKEKYAILGSHITHSLSPFMHKRLFELSGRKADYTVYDIDDLEDFYPLLDGYNVTIPHKQTIIKKLNGLDSFAEDLGAVNCVNKDKIGFNTDFYGFKTSFDKFYSLDTGRVLLLGYGGVGRVIARALKGYELYIAVRDGDKRRDEISAETGATVVDIDNIPDIRFDALVNATPVGMYPKTDAMPIDERVIANIDNLYDTVYNPTKTLLLKTAEKMGKRIKSGVDMLVYQAVAAHGIWYGGKFRDEDIEKLVCEVAECVEKGEWR